MVVVGRDPGPAARCWRRPWWPGWPAPGRRAPGRGAADARRGVPHRRDRADFGVMLSASHNPMPDNGIKLFAPAGTSCPTSSRTDRGAAVGAPGSGRPGPRSAGCTTWSTEPSTTPAPGGRDAAPPGRAEGRGRLRQRAAAVGAGGGLHRGRRRGDRHQRRARRAQHQRQVRFDPPRRGARGRRRARGRPRHGARRRRRPLPRGGRDRRGGRRRPDDGDPRGGHAGGRHAGRRTPWSRP